MLTRLQRPRQTQTPARPSFSTPHPLLAKARSPHPALTPSLPISTPGDRFEREADRLAADVMRGRAATSGSSRGESSLQRREDGAPAATAPHQAPPAVREAVGSPGRPLDAAARVYMEPRFGYDFSRVRIHADERAAASARGVNALAYTVGNDIVFAAGRYAPMTPAGRRLLAHELAHVVQQHAGAQGVIQRQEKPGPETQGQATPTTAPVAQPASNALDAQAKAIIAKAQDSTIDAKVRAVEVVKLIIDTYYPGEKSKVESVVFDDAKAGSGLDTLEVPSSDGNKAKSKGKISVGNYFLNGTTQIHLARRVLQVGHELEHIKQWRTGLAGGQHSKEREFLAFYHEALDPEKPGTGRMQHSTRLLLIDGGALHNYYCMSPAKQKEHESKKKEILDRRLVEIKAGGRAAASPPTTCK